MNRSRNERPSGLAIPAWFLSNSPVSTAFVIRQCRGGLHCGDQSPVPPHLISVPHPFEVYRVSKRGFDVLRQCGQLRKLRIRQ